jgi:glycosyltransferase involved in cell wall biosynthesis
MTQSKILNGLILIPAYDEGRSLAAVVRAARAVLPALVVDDGSRDDTARQARSAGAIVLSNERNLGKGASLQVGFRYALERGYDFAVTLDADGQHDPHEIPLFLKAYAERGSDLIIGQRDFSSMPPLRRLSNTLGTRFFSWAVGRHIPDNQSGYRMVSRRLMEFMRQPAEHGFEFELEMILACILHHCSMDWVPIRTIYADESSHIHPLHHLVKFVQVSLRAKRILRNVRNDEAT